MEKYFEHIAKNCTTPVTVNLRTCSKNTSDARINRVENLDVFSAFIQFKNDISFADRLVDFHDSLILVQSSGSSELVETNNSNVKFSYFSSKLQSKDVTFSTEIEVPPFAYHQPTLEASIIVSIFLRCEMIELDLHDFDVNVNTSGIYFQELRYFLQKNDYISSNESYIRVCAKDYIAATENIISDSSFFFINVLSIVCACLSVVSLIITLSVYGLLTELRTQPGLNNMFLSMSLLAAYIGLFIGGVRSVSGLWCSIIGLLVHFLWLNSAFWLNICCYHMFRTFGTIRVPIEKKTSWMYHVYCLVNSTILININIIWSLSASGGTSIGYGKHSAICYIFYPQMIGYTMTLPVGIVVASNIIMYGTVLYKIRKDSFRTSAQTSRRHLSIYIKLLTVTGISWLSYIPAILIRNDVFDAIASVLVACQGVYIMFAFVCNTRVLVLLRAYATEGRKLSVNSSISEKMHKAQEQKFVVNKERGTTTTLV